MTPKLFIASFVLFTAVASVSTAEPDGSAAKDPAVGRPTGSVAPHGSAWTRYRPEANLFEVGLYGGIFFPASSHQLVEPSRQHRPFAGASPELGLRVAYFPWAFLGAELEAAAVPAKVEGGGGAGIWAARGHAVAQLTAHRITPFLLVGYGALGSLSQEMGADTDDAMHFGLGAKAAIDSSLSVRVDLRDTLSQKYADGSALVHHPELLLGLSMTLDRSKPKPPPPPPPDGDHDGVVDAADACPTVSANTPNGCPADSDADGIEDPRDHCPANAGPAPDGCPPPPDGDLDGVLDSNDECPEVAGDLANGCPNPDADRDGIAASQDQCPTQPETINGFKDDDGCPDEVPEAVRRFTGVIQGIEFDQGKATLRRDSRPLLDKAVETLTTYPDVRLRITGHTDDLGDRQRNVELSQKRADAVKEYLVSKGIEPARITTRGAGPDEPLVAEKTAAARQKNRRIEFSILDH